MLGLLVVVTFFLGARGESDLSNITSLGYPAEEHTVTTADGYILSLQRIPYGKDGNSTTGKKVVLLMHGILGAYTIFTYLGSEYGMAYNLVNAGFDVWMGNARGNGFSSKHVSLDRDANATQFYNYSYEELGLYDLPAMIDYILNATNSKKLHYIGHSQGGSLFFVLNSRNTSYQSKFASAHLLSGTGYVKHYPNAQSKNLSEPINIMYNLSQRIGLNVLDADSRSTKVLFEFLVNSTVPIEVMANSSLKQVVHYMQNFRDGAFRSFDYGAAANILKYGSSSPTTYDLSKINVTTVLHYTVNDAVQNATDAIEMAKVMKNATSRKVAKSDFKHMDFVISPDAKTLVTDYVIEFINSY